MPRRNSDNQQVNIFNFSFLDIIACTVGALVFVLVMFMLHASQEAYKATSPKREEDLLAGIADNLKGKADLKILEDKLAAAREQAEKLGLGRDITIEKLKAENESKKLEIARLADKILALQQKASVTKEAPVGIWIEVLEPQEGPLRKPYLVECRRGGIYLIEENVSETYERTRESTSRWNALRQRVAESAEDDFILLLVRPDGIWTFNRLRSQLRRLKIPLGYEPILSDWKILGISE
jgi:hypothetical protein